jgi:hypothetical protein
MSLGGTVVREAIDLMLLELVDDGAEVVMDDRACDSLGGREESDGVVEGTTDFCHSELENAEELE